MPNHNLLQDDDPIINVISRILAWESKINAVGLREVDEERLFILIEDEIDTRITSNQFNSRKDDIDRWRKKKVNDWRHLYLPSHFDVRTQAYSVVERDFNPNYRENMMTFELAFRNPTLPWLEVLMGVGDPPLDETEYMERRAIYMLRHNKLRKSSRTVLDIPDSLYIGKADDSFQRMQQHREAKNPHFWLMAMPAEASQQFNGDVRDATEALSIALWSEVAYISNSNFGTTIPPASKVDLLYAIALTTAISSAFLHIMREKKDFIIKDLGIDEKLVNIPLLNVYGKERYTQQTAKIKRQNR